MKIALYSRLLKPKDIAFVQQLLCLLMDKKVQLFIYEDYYQQLQTIFNFPDPIATFSDHQSLVGKVDYLFSIGGDGTLLDTIAYVKDSGIPILGINIGRLGLLANAARTDMENVLNGLVRQEFILDKRTLIQLDSNIPIFEDVNYALNEFAIHKKDTSAMISIHTYVGNKFLNSYWADGIIVATPTGSTAYSMSCGGAIISPEAEVFIITPVAPHNLNIRPMVVADKETITFKVEGREPHFLCALDSRNETIDQSYHLSVRKADFTINLIRFNGTNFFETIRNKLMWGVDTRN